MRLHATGVEQFRQLKLGIIGDGVHSLRIQKILRGFGEILIIQTKQK